MSNEDFYALLNQAGHRFGDLAKNSSGYEFELRKLIDLVQNQYQAFGYYWEEPDLDCPDVTTSGIYFGDPKEVLDGEDITLVYIKQDATKPNN